MTDCKTCNSSGKIKTTIVSPPFDEVVEVDCPDCGVQKTPADRIKLDYFAIAVETSRILRQPPAQY